MVFQEEKERENGVLLYIYFETKKLGWLLIINWEFCLWEWNKLSIANKYRYNYGLDKRET